jgi:hypothetical protein
MGNILSGTSRGLFTFQNCNFPEESFILIRFCYSVDKTAWYLKKKETAAWAALQRPNS